MSNFVEPHLESFLNSVFQHVQSSAITKIYVLHFIFRDIDMYEYWNWYDLDSDFILKKNELVELLETLY